MTTMTTVGQLKVNMCKFTWKIKNFSKIGSQVTDYIMSPIFQMQDFCESHWKLQMFPFGENDELLGFLSLYLCNESQVKVDACYKLILSDVNEEEILQKISHYNFEPKQGYGWSKFFKRDCVLQKTGGLLGDILNITCIIYVDMYSVEEVDIDKQIFNNYESLFHNADFSDLTIAVKKNYLNVHKSILSARSPVFKAMFSHNMKEKNTNTIKITDVSYHIMKEVLLFIYSGKINDLSKDAKALLQVAEKYEIKDLKILCEKSISMNVKIEDACEILGMADLYNCSKLKAKVIEFIVPNIKSIKETPGFKTLIRSNPELFEELFDQIVEK